MKGDTAFFFGQWMGAPGTTGAVAPSSARLAAAVTAPLPARGEPLVVELGPGTGAFSAEIQHRLAGRGRHLAIEVNPLMAELLAHRYPRTEVIVDDATRLAKLMEERGLSEADLIVSGLPFAAFDAERQRRLVDAVASCMGPMSAFTTFGYSFARLSPPAARFRRLLGEIFEEVVISRTVWRNVPPAFVYSARRPREAEVRG